MLTNKITGFSANFLDAVKNVLGEAKKCGDCGCGQCECEDEEEVKEGYESHAQRKAVWANRADDGAGHPDKKKKKMKEEGYMPTSDEPTAANKKTADRVRAMLAKEKKPVKETADMPFAKPYKKVSDRKDEYGNTVKNVAKHLAKKAMNKQKNEEVDMGQAEQGMRKSTPHTGGYKVVDSSGKVISTHKGQRDAMQAALKNDDHRVKPVREEIEQVYEISANMANRYLAGKRKRDYDISPDGFSSKLKKPQSFGKMNKDMTSTIRALRTIEKSKKTNEEAEGLDEISKATMGSYINKAKDSIDTASYRQGNREALGGSSRPLERKLSKRHKGISTAVSKLTKEESEQIDELSKATLGSYVKKATNQAFSKGYSGGSMMVRGDINRDSEEEKAGEKNVNKAIKRVSGVTKAVSKLTKEEQDFINTLNADTLDEADMPKGLQDRAPRGRARNAMGRASAKQERNLARARMDRAARKMEEETEQVDEVSKNLMLRYVSANKKSDKAAQEKGDYSKSDRRMRGTDVAVRKYTARDNKYVRVPATEEVDLDEARGRPRKAGAKDFTIHPKTKEKLMHDNPADMKRIEALQKTGALQKPKTEANQHVINQLQKAKLSMQGGTTINFTHGDSKHVSGTHASKILGKYAGMKPDEKEAFQKDIGHSHARLMKHV